MSLGISGFALFRPYFEVTAAVTSRQIVSSAYATPDATRVPTRPGARDPSSAHAEPGPSCRDARLPRRVDATALLSPFDNLVWFRERDERLFDFHYRIEIYTPAPKRTYGYYVLPFLHGDTIVGRVDVKADRKAKTLVVPGAFAEPGVDAAAVADALAGELSTMASWLGLERVTVGRKGDLSTQVRRVLGTLAAGGSS